MADWRIRPLPAELIDYARTDTHYLLYVAAKMKNEILAGGGGGCGGGKKALLSVLNQSSQVALSVYQKPVFDPEVSKRMHWTVRWM